MSPRDWLIKYCNETIADKKYRCTKHRQSCKKCLEMLEKSEDEDNSYYFDNKQAENIVSFFAMLRHSKGVIAGKPIIVDGLSKYILYNIYGFKQRATDYRLITKAFISMGRKGQKSQLQSGMALYDMSVLATKWKTLNECYCSGNTRKQSGVIFEECKLMLRGTPLAVKFKITRDKIIHIKTGSFLEPLSKEAKKSGEGSNPHMAIIDEYKDSPDNLIYEALETGQKAQPQPLMIIISTAGNDTSVPMFVDDYPYATKILNGSVINDKYFTVICEVEEGDDIDDWLVWQKANQLLYTYEVGIQGLKDSYEIAKEVPSKMLSFKVKNLNMWQNKSVDGYMPMDKFRECVVNKSPIDIKGKDVYIGIDVSAKTDLTAVTFEIPFIQESGELGFIIYNHSFVPTKEKLMEHQKVDKMPFILWEQQGFITVCNTPIVDQKQVMKYCYDFVAENKLNIKAWGVDPANASMLTTSLLEDNQSVFEIYQSKKHLNEPTVGLRESTLCKNVYYIENPCFTWQIGNAYVETDSNGYIKIDKRQQKKRIDNVDSSICSHKLAMYWKPTIDLESEIMSGRFSF